MVCVRAQANKPFAVVPCCVFAVDFPNRRGTDGRSIDTHGAFVNYLQAKAPDRIGVTTLPFEGKNLVVYSFPVPQIELEEMHSQTDVDSTEETTEVTQEERQLNNSIANHSLCQVCISEA